MRKHLATAGLVLLGVLALTGCAPNTDKAYTACVNAGLANVSKDQDSKTYVEIAVKVADYCQAQAKADPAAFNAVWAPAK